MSGLIALLDDVAGIAKTAAASLDDVATQAAKAGVKAAGAVIDDAAVTPKYVQGFAPARELPIIGRIAWGSIKNKLLILLPAALVLSTFAPWMITPLLMLGGAYLCFEGAEKVWHSLFPTDHSRDETPRPKSDPAHLEQSKVAGAIKTDFILSAEIMTIILAALPDGSLFAKAGGLAIAGIGITVAVYGAVALIVKLDDIGLFLARNSRMNLTRSFGLGLVRSMPKVMKILTIIGTAAMIWVGGSILLHGSHTLGLHLPYDLIHHLAETAAETTAQWAPQSTGFVTWAVTATLDGIIGLIIGVLLLPIATRVITPLWTTLFQGRA